MTERDEELKTVWQAWADSFKPKPNTMTLGDTRHLDHLVRKAVFFGYEAATAKAEERIKKLEADLAALKSQSQEPLTDMYVQRVPDKCDRIVWRNNYYHLPLNNAAPPIPDDKVMVPRIATKEMWDAVWDCIPYTAKKKLSIADIHQMFHVFHDAYLIAASEEGK